MATDGRKDGRLNEDTTWGIVVHTSDRDTFRRVAGHTGDIPWRWRSAVPASHPWSSPGRASLLRGEATALLHTDRVCQVVIVVMGVIKVVVVIVMVVMVCEFRARRTIVNYYWRRAYV